MAAAKRCHQCLQLVTDFVLVINYPYKFCGDEPAYTFCNACDSQFVYPPTPDATYVPQFYFVGAAGPMPAVTN